MKEKNEASPERLRHPLEDNRGSLLVVALWVILILGSFSVSMGYHVRQKVTLANRLDVRSTLYGIAQAGVQKALVELKPEDLTLGPAPGFNMLNESWSVGEQLFQNVPIGEGSFTVSYEYTDPREGVRKTRYGVQDEESKVNVNTADVNVISRIFQITAGVEEEKADRIAYGIVDWRDSDSFLSHPLDGAEDYYYEGLRFPYGAKNEPFEVLNELLLVRGVTPEIFEKAADKLTVYGNGDVNINTASKEVLSALDLDESLVNKILAYRAGTDQLEATDDDRGFIEAGTIVSSLDLVYPVSDAETVLLNNLVSKGTLVTESKYFMVRSRGELKNGMTLELTAVFYRDNGTILFWSAGMPKRR